MIVGRWISTVMKLYLINEERYNWSHTQKTGFTAQVCYAVLNVIIFDGKITVTSF